jgi:cytochrome P450
VGLPPGPSWTPAAATLRWLLNPVALMEGCRERYGDAFTIRFMHEGTSVLLSHPDDIKALFTAEPTAVHAGEGRRLMQPVFGPSSILCLDESEHAAQRRLLLPPFHGDRLARYSELIADATASEIATWNLGVPIRLAPRFRAIALEIILRAMFGVEDAQRAAPLRQAIERLLALASSLPRLVPLMLLGPNQAPRLPHVRRLLVTFDTLVLEEIARRKADPQLDSRPDILSILLSARDADGAQMPARAVRDQLVTLLIAGHETTATALSWAVERLVHTPAAMEALTTDIAAGSQDYVEAVVKEVLRVRPVLPVVSRLVKRPLELRACTLPPGTVVAACTYLVHRRADVYPEPDRFLPERFLTTSPGTYTWIPFGGGVRRCLGGSFAMLEMKTVLRVTIEQLRLMRASAGPEPVGRRAITLAPRRGCQIIAEARRIGVKPCS